MAFFGVFGFVVAFPLRLAAQDVLTYHNDAARTGQYPNETKLSPQNVNPATFGKLFSYGVDGYVYAQPLYKSNVPITGNGTHNVIFVATEHNSVYAFDADSNAGANANPLWSVNLGPSVPSSDVASTDIVPEIGITGTPVIDPGTGTFYVVAKTKENGSYLQRLHALDLGSGQEKFGGPVLIQASVPGTGDGNDGNGNVPFDPLRQNQRTGLLLAGGVVYISWASHGDNGPYHGWVIGYDALSLAQKGVYCTTPNGGLGGIWMSGGGPAADSGGQIFFITGNGTFQAGSDYGDSFIRLSTSGGGLSFSDYFTPFNQQALSDGDLDLGAGGVVLLPDQSGAHPHVMVGAGKEGRIYLVDRDNLGQFQSGSDNVVQELPGALSGVFSTPAYFNGMLYYKGIDGALVAYSLSGGALSPSPVSQSNATWTWPGSTPSISSNGASNGIVWAVENGVSPAVLHAFDASNLANELYNSNQQPNDAPGAGVKFTVPTVAAGRVYVGTVTGLAVYGLTQAIAINSGGGPVGSFVADTDVSGGYSYSTTQSVDTSAVPDPAPQGVYQSERAGAFTYVVPGLAAGATYTVRLHFAEIWWSQAGQRVFSVAINGTTVLSNFDIVGAAGAAFRAIVKEFTAQADPSGQITIAYLQGSVDWPKSSGIEIIPSGIQAPPPSLAIDSGGGAFGNFVADTDVSGGQSYTTTQTVDTSAVPNPAPQGVYQSERWGAFTYVVPGLTAGASFTVRLHFAEIWWSQAGQRVFSVAINGTTVLSNFDIVGAAGASFRAIVKEFPAQADASGQITIAYIQGSVDWPKSSGIEIIPSAAQGPLPAPWAQADVGSVGTAGSASYDGSTGTFTILASGSDIWDTADSFHFVYQPLSGDGTLVARVMTLGDTDPWAKAGVMIRETLSAGSTQAMTVITPGNGSAFQRRTASGGGSTHTPGPFVSAPYWVRISRSGATFTGSVSADGSNWTVVDSVNIPMATTVWVGLAVTAHNNAAVTTSTLDHVSLSSP